MYVATEDVEGAYRGLRELEAELERVGNLIERRIAQLEKRGILKLIPLPEEQTLESLMEILEINLSNTGIIHDANDWLLNRLIKKQDELNRDYISQHERCMGLEYLHGEQQTPSHEDMYFR